MTKEELIAKMAASAGITKVAAGTALEAFTGAVTSSLKKGQRVSLVNFGTFTISSGKHAWEETREQASHSAFRRRKYPSFQPEKSFASQ